MFQSKHFEVFHQENVEDALNQIRRYVQSVLRKYGVRIQQQVLDKTIYDHIPVHVAKHIRRKVTMPFNTWVAVGGDGRGYKKYCHLQLGINRKYVFLVVALIDHPPYEKEIMQAWQAKSTLLDDLPEDFVFIDDHTDYPWRPLKNMTMSEIVARAQEEHKCDTMIGRLIEREDMEAMESEDFDAWVSETTDYLIPFLAAGRAVDLDMRGK